MPPIVIMIKPASSLCNLRCKYCFYLDTAQNRETASYGIMSENTLENVVKKAFEFADMSISFAFQGGEPTLAGLHFFEKFIEFQKKYAKEYAKKDIEINNAIQTNAVNIDADFAKFFHDNNFLVGVSLDGAKQYHDIYRKFADGKGSYNKVILGINLLKKYEVDFNILCVINRITARNIKEIYNFYKKNGFNYLQFIPCLQPFGQESQRLSFTLSAKDWGKCLCELFDLWYADFIKGNEIHIRQFENYIEMLLGYPPESCGMSGVCSYQNIIEADGSCYPCDFYVLDKFKLGNLNEVGFEEVYEVRKQINFLEDSLKINKKCFECKFSGICRGGCKRYCEPLNDKDERSINILCEGYRIFFEHSYEKMKKLAQYVAQQK
ncbi:MAG: anaerobic sulfatase maturase [Clostridia bacterium]